VGEGCEIEALGPVTKETRALTAEEMNGARSSEELR
jgi:hypothetical protein